MRATFSIKKTYKKLKVKKLIFYKMKNKRVNKSKTKTKTIASYDFILHKTWYTRNAPVLLASSSCLKACR